MGQPFSWSSVKHRLAGQPPTEFDLPPEAPPHFVKGIQRCAARVLALSGNADMIFLGRSPESIYDYLSGVLEGTSWESRCRLLNYSNRNQPLKQLRSSFPAAVKAMRAQLRWFALEPCQFQFRVPAALVDLVYQGSTLGHLTEFLFSWAREEGLDVSVIKRKLRFVGITLQTKTSPKTWRWQQQVPWARQFSSRAIKNVSIPGQLWCYLGNEQSKVFQSNPPAKWTDISVQLRSRFGARTCAQQVALYMYNQGRDRKQRQDFLKLLTAEPAIRYRWLRTLMLEIRGRP
jgi:hypothetical protein